MSLFFHQICKRMLTGSINHKNIFITSTPQKHLSPALYIASPLEVMCAKVILDYGD